MLIPKITRFFILFLFYERQMLRHIASNQINNRAKEVKKENNKNIKSIITIILIRIEKEEIQNDFTSK